MSPIRMGPMQLATGVTAIIPAAGSGSRMGDATPKQFLPLAGIPVLARTLLLFEQEPRVDELIVAAGAGQVEETRALVRAHGIRKVTRVVPGGATRQESVAAALALCTQRPRIVAVHDAARPLLPPALLAGILDAAADRPAQVMAVPVQDTVKVVDKAGTVAQTLARDTLWAAQTPQVFHADLLTRAHRQAQADGFAGTDCAALVERLGVAVTVFPGTPENLKLTTPADFALAEVLLSRRQA